MQSQIPVERFPGLAAYQPVPEDISLARCRLRSLNVPAHYRFDFSRPDLYKPLLLDAYYNDAVLNARLKYLDSTYYSIRGNLFLFYARVRRFRDEFFQSSHSRADKNNAGLGSPKIPFDSLSSNLRDASLTAAREAKSAVDACKEGIYDLIDQLKRVVPPERSSIIMEAYK